MKLSLAVNYVCRHLHLPKRPAVRRRVDRIALFSELSVLAGTLILCGYAPAGAAGQFAPPDLAGFTRHSEREADGDGDGVKETQIVQYLNGQGDSIVSMTTNGRVWAWSLETRDNPSSVRNYVIRDSDCDGIFDEVYGLDDKFHVPDCLKK
jgi:hypothetical protein